MGLLLPPDQNWWKGSRLHLCLNLSHPTLCKFMSFLNAGTCKCLHSQLSRRMLRQSFSLAEFGSVDSRVYCAPGSRRPNPDRRWEGGEGTHVRETGRGCGRLTGVLALTPKDRGDEQRQQHQRLGSPEADHGSPRGLAEPGPGEAQRGGRARSGSGSLPCPHAGGPRFRRKRQETRQPSSSLRLLPAEAPVICARSLLRLANRPKPRAAPSPLRGCNLSPRPRSPPRRDQSPHLPRPDSPLVSSASRPPCAQWPDRAGHRDRTVAPIGTAGQPPQPQAGRGASGPSLRSSTGVTGEGVVCRGWSSRPGSAKMWGRRGDRKGQGRWGWKV